MELTVRNKVLSVSCTAIDGAAEWRQDCPELDCEAIVPLDALADCEGKDDTVVQIHPSTDQQVELRWMQNGVPQVRTYAMPEMKSAFPMPPKSWRDSPIELLDALHEAAATTAPETTRYALDRVQLKGSTGEVVASDSKQLLIQGGFEFPWKDDVLISRSALGMVKALPRIEPLQIGRTDGLVWLQIGPWTVALSIAADGRYPDVHAIVPQPKSDSTRLTLDPTDADLLVTVLPDLPGADEPFSPVTLDLNGTVAVRAKTPTQSQATELVLARSRVSGPALRVVMDRLHLGRARKLGFDSFDLVSPSRPWVCRNGRRTYVSMPLEEKSAILPSDDVLRVGGATHAVTRPTKPVEKAATPARRKGADTTKSAKPSPTNHGPIEEAMAIQADLRNVLGRLRGLSALIRRQRQQHRLVKQTLASLKQLQGVGA